jgi:hypothetical protein
MEGVRTILTKEQKIEMFVMKLDGYTLQEIGDKYGISRQRVQAILSSGSKGPKYIAKIKYFNVATWLRHNSVCATNLAKEAGLTPWRFTKFLKGEEDCRFSIRQIKTLLEITGMNFEDFFSEEK